MSTKFTTMDVRRDCAYEVDGALDAPAELRIEDLHVLRLGLQRRSAGVRAASRRNCRSYRFRLFSSSSLFSQSSGKRSSRSHGIRAAEDARSREYGVAVGRMLK
ncbi:MAG: hypothetical protein MZV64_74155 [Ignavibacteriales bacterium]|nr:hypothetical protein [Ignavibacteriales bacterium]